MSHLGQAIMKLIVSITIMLLVLGIMIKMLANLVGMGEEVSIFIPFKIIWKYIIKPILTFLKDEILKGIRSLFHKEKKKKPPPRRRRP